MNFIPDTLSRLKVKSNIPPEKRLEGEIILNNIWFLIAEPQIDLIIKERLKIGYRIDSKFNKILNNFTEIIKDNGNAFRPGYPFIINDGLIYNLRNDKFKSLYILKDYI